MHNVPPITHKWLMMSTGEILTNAMNKTDRRGKVRLSGVSDSGDQVFFAAAAARWMRLANSTTLPDGRDVLQWVADLLKYTARYHDALNRSVEARYMMRTLRDCGGKRGDLVQKLLVSDMDSIKNYIIKAVNRPACSSLLHETASALASFEASVLGWVDIDIAQKRISEAADFVISKYIGDGWFNNAEQEKSCIVDNTSFMPLYGLLALRRTSLLCDTKSEIVENISRDFANTHAHFTDRFGEIDKWGSMQCPCNELIAAALCVEIAVRDLCDNPDVLYRCAQLHLDYFKNHGLGNAQVYPDRGEGFGVVDALINTVTSTGMAAIKLTDIATRVSYEVSAPPIITEKESFVRYFPAPSLWVFNNAQTGFHVVIPIKSNKENAWTKCTMYETRPYIGQSARHPQCEGPLPFVLHSIGLDPSEQVGLGEIIEDENEPRVKCCYSSNSMQQEVIYGKSPDNAGMRIVYRITALTPLRPKDLRCTICPAPETELIWKGDNFKKTRPQKDIIYSVYGQTNSPTQLLLQGSGMRSNETREWVLDVEFIPQKDW